MVPLVKQKQLLLFGDIALLAPKLQIELNKPMAFRPNQYDQHVLEMIRDAHPQLPDVSSLIREALRQYDISRRDGSKSQMIAESLSILRLLAAQHEIVVSSLDASPAGRGEFDRCDNAPGSEQ